MLLQAFYEESKKKWSYHKILISLIYFVFIILGFYGTVGIRNWWNTFNLCTFWLEQKFCHRGEVLSNYILAIVWESF